MGFLQGLYEDTVAPGRDGQYRGTGLGAARNFKAVC